MPSFKPIRDDEYRVVLQGIEWDPHAPPTAPDNAQVDYVEADSPNTALAYVCATLQRMYHARIVRIRVQRATRMTHVRNPDLHP